jgi:hypothetical protein
MCTPPVNNRVDGGPYQPVPPLVSGITKGCECQT